MSRFGNNDITATLPIALFGSVDYYATMGAFSHVIIDDTLRYDKRCKSTHRFTVADTHGIKNLTVPVGKPDGVKGPLRWSDITLSRHGMWWHVIEETLASAYGRTPFFEFYIDRLRPFFASTTVDDYHDVATLCRESDRAIRAILKLDNDITYASTLKAERTMQPPGDKTAFRELQPPGDKTTLQPPGDKIAAQEAGDKTALYKTEEIGAEIRPVEYYQVRADKFGFLPDLSILDLIFNMGPESPLILHEMTLPGL